MTYHFSHYEYEDAPYSDAQNMDLAALADPARSACSALRIMSRVVTLILQDPMVTLSGRREEALIAEYEAILKRADQLRRIAFVIMGINGDEGDYAGINNAVMSIMLDVAASERQTLRARAGGAPLPAQTHEIALPARVLTVILNSIVARAPEKFNPDFSGMSVLHARQLSTIVSTPRLYGALSALAKAPSGEMSMTPASVPSQASAGERFTPSADWRNEIVQKLVSMVLEAGEAIVESMVSVYSDAGNGDVFESSFDEEPGKLVDVRWLDAQGILSQESYRGCLDVMTTVVSHDGADAVARATAGGTVADRIAYLSSPQFLSVVKVAFRSVVGLMLEGAQAIGFEEIGEGGEDIGRMEQIVPLPEEPAPVQVSLRAAEGAA